MSNIRPFRNTQPSLGTDVFVADTALVIGDVTIGDQSSIWFHSVLRGDINTIRVGVHTNLQDGTVVHVDAGTNPVVIHDEVTIGHHATIHGCVIESRCLIGMGATILSGAVVKSGALVAAGSLVREGQVVPEKTVVAGVPAKVVRDISAEERDMITNSASHYVDYARIYLNQEGITRQ